MLIYIHTLAVGEKYGFVDEDGRKIPSFRYLWVFWHMFICIYVWILTHMHACIHTYTQVFRTSVSASIHTFIHTLMLPSIQETKCITHWESLPFSCTNMLWLCTHSLCSCSTQNCTNYETWHFLNEYQQKHILFLYVHWYDTLSNPFIHWTTRPKLNQRWVWHTHKCWPTSYTQTVGCKSI